MTDKTIQEIEKFVRQWAPAGREIEMIKALGELVMIASAECAEYIIAGLGGTA